VIKMIENRVNSPLTSSAGRLFDAVSFICGLAPQRVEYEAEAPSRLEAAASSALLKRKQLYGYDLKTDFLPYRIDFSPAVSEIVFDLKKRVKKETIALKFHLTLVEVINRMAILARKEYGIKTVVITGGVFLNRILTENVEKSLKKNGFEVLRPVFYSPGDESLSLGQIAYALNRIKSSL